MMGLVAHRAFDSEETTHSTVSERQVLSSASRPAKIEKRQITRNRTSYSCQNCRKRKIKCDKVHPKCGACVKNGDECVYGKLEAAIGDNSPALNGLNDQSASSATKSHEENHSPTSTTLPTNSDAQIGHLTALENQLARLTTLVGNLRKDSGPSAPSGLPTPASSLSSNPDGTNALDGSSPVDVDLPPRTDAGALQRPMSELNITREGVGQIRQVKNAFWESISEELDQLQNLLRRPLGNIPEAFAETDEYSTNSRPEPSQLLPGNDESSVIGYHQAVHGHTRPQATDGCQLCRQTSVDKSIFLLGEDSRQALTMQKFDLTAGVPSESQSNALFRAWITGVFPILPYTALARPFRKYSKFWEWKRQYDHSPESVTESADIHFMPVINFIWYAGTLAMSAKGFQTWFPGQSRAELAAHYHDQIVRYLAFLSFPNNVTLPFIGILVMVEQLLAVEQEPIQSSSYLNLILRLVQSLGLHRESSQTGLNHPADEWRRRTWWSVVRLDTALSLSSGMPLSIDDDLSDCRLISEVKEYAIGSEAEEIYHADVLSGRQKADLVDDPWGDTKSIVSVYHLVNKASLSIDITLRQVLRLHMNPRQMTRDTLTTMRNIISNTEDAVKKVINSIPTKGVPELGFEPEATSASVYDGDPSLGSSLEESELSSYFGLEPSALPMNLARYYRQKLCAFHKWARIALSLMCDKMHCVAYAPFLKNARSKLWTAARQCALRHATSFLRKFVSLASDPCLESFRWSWPAMYQPMHATIILLVDIYERPFSVEAPRNRSWIDRVFALASPNSGIVGGLNGPSTQRPLKEGGTEAWCQLRGLRSAAWRKAGLDPDVLWTEEDQMLVGVAQPLTQEQRVAQTLREDLLYVDSSKRGSEAPGSKEAWAGTQYLMQIARDEAQRGKILEYALSGQAEQVFATIKPCASRLVRLEGQQPMPFPMSPAIAHKCRKAEKEWIDSVRKEKTYKKETILIEDLIRKIKQHVDSQGGPSSRAGDFHEIPDMEPTTGVSTSQTKLQEVYNLTTPNITAFTRKSDDPSKIAFNGIVPNGLQVDYSSIQERQPEARASNSEVGTDGTPENGGSEDSFDWDRWDAVFGQYGGFTDIMEDIQWEEPPQS